MCDGDKHDDGGGQGGEEGGEEGREKKDARLRGGIGRATAPLCPRETLLRTVGGGEAPGFPAWIVRWWIRREGGGGV